MALQQQFETNTIDYITPKWEFIWSDNNKPKLPIEITKELTKNWKYIANRMIEMKSIIGILEKNNANSTQIINSETQECANIDIDLLKKEYAQRIANLEIIAKNDDNDKESLNAKSVLFLNNIYDYNNQNNLTKNIAFISAILGTATMINGIEKEAKETIDLESKISQENKENLNYFGRKILEQKEKPLNKEEFINDLKNHAKNTITKDEIIILCKMFDLPKPPSLLNNEHKKLIKESLKIAISYEKTKDFDETLKKEIQSVIDRKDSAPKKEKAKNKEANLLSM